MICRPAVLALLVGVLSGGTVGAQSTPPPSGALPPPLTGYVGRYVDSAQTMVPSRPERVVRAMRVKIAPERGLILMALGGSRFGVYNIGSFAGRVATEPLSVGASGEKYLPPDVFTVLPESSPGWITPSTGIQDMVDDFDYDDRGYFYLAYSAWGFAIVDSTGVLVKQLFPPLVDTQSVLTVHSGATVLALVSNSGFATVVYDVTNPAAPVLLRTIPIGIRSYAKLASGAVAVASGFGNLDVYASGADLAAGNAPMQTVLPQTGMVYQLVTTDGISIFAAQTSTSTPPFSTVVSTLTLMGGTFAETRNPPVPLFPSDLLYGAGYVVFSGFGSSRGAVVYERGLPNSRNLIPYFSAAYPPGLVGADSVAPYESGRQTYLIVAFFGIGDLFALSESPGAQIPAFSTATVITLIVVFAAIGLLRLR